MELLACKLLPLLLLTTVFIISLLNITTFCEGAGRATNFNAKSGEKDEELGETRKIPFVDYTSQPVEPVFPYYNYGSLGSMYLPVANSEVAAAAGEDGLIKGGLLFNGGTNYGGGGPSYGGYGAPPYQGIFGLFPRGLLGFPRGLFGLPRGILGLPRFFFGFPVLPGGATYGGIPAAPGGGYGGRTIPPGGGYGGGLPGPGNKPGGGGGYGVNPHP